MRDVLCVVVLGCVLLLASVLLAVCAMWYTGVKVVRVVAWASRCVRAFAVWLQRELFVTLFEEERNRDERDK